LIWLWKSIRISWITAGCKGIKYHNNQINKYHNTQTVPRGRTVHALKFGRLKSKMPFSGVNTITGTFLIN